MDNEVLILHALKDGTLTANEAINLIFFEDQKNRIRRPGWKFYNHLNKYFSPLEKKGFIKMVGKKQNGQNRFEKLWILTKKAQEAILEEKQIS